MSEQEVEVGNPGEGAPSPDAGSTSFLGGIENVDTPLETTEPVTGERQQTADGAAQDVIDGPPEHVPEKFWDKEKKQVNVEELGKGYKNLEHLLSREKVPVPQDDDDAEGWERWTAAVRPESEDKYDFGAEAIESELPEGLSYDTELEKGYRSAAFAAGLHPKQAATLHDMFVKTQIERQQQWNKAQQEREAEMHHARQREFGQELPAVQQRIGAMFTKYDDTKEFRELLNENPVLGNDPRAVRFFNKMAKSMSGDAKLIGKPTETAQPADLDLAIAQFREKNEKVLFDASHPRHQAANAELQKLYEARYPSNAA